MLEDAGERAMRRRSAASVDGLFVVADGKLPERIEDQAKLGELAEVQAVSPVLQAIYEDSSVMNVVRARARRIMEMKSLPPAK